MSPFYNFLLKHFSDIIAPRILIAREWAGLLFLVKRHPPFLMADLIEGEDIYIDICLLTFMTLWNHEVSPPFWTLIAPMHHWQHSKEFHLRCQNKLGFPLTYNLIWIFPTILCLLQKKSLWRWVNLFYSTLHPSSLWAGINVSSFCQPSSWSSIDCLGGCMLEFSWKQSLWLNTMSRTIARDPSELYDTPRNSGLVPSQHLLE